MNSQEFLNVLNQRRSRNSLSLFTLDTILCEDGSVKIIEVGDAGCVINPSMFQKLVRVLEGETFNPLGRDFEITTKKEPEIPSGERGSYEVDFGDYDFLRVDLSFRTSLCFPRPGEILVNHPSFVGLARNKVFSSLCLGSSAPENIHFSSYEELVDEGEIFKGGPVAVKSALGSGGVGVKYFPNFDPDKIWNYRQTFDIAAHFGPLPDGLSEDERELEESLSRPSIVQKWVVGSPLLREDGVACYSCDRMAVMVKTEGGRTILSNLGGYHRLEPISKGPTTINVHSGATRQSWSEQYAQSVMRPATLGIARMVNNFLGFPCSNLEEDWDVVNSKTASPHQYLLDDAAFSPKQ